MKTQRKRAEHGLLVAVALFGLNGCLSMSGSDDSSRDVSPLPPDSSDNNPPTISGQPAPAVAVGTTYSFTPTASDPDGDTLTFSVQNLPRWATFDSATGELSGLPQLGDVGMFSNIRVSVSDGNASDSLQQFSIEVSQMALGSVTLSWGAPTQNNDGSPLTDLIAYNIYYGTSPGNYPNSIRVNNPGVTSYVVENLVPNTYYFVSTAVSGSGAESGYSNMASRTVN